MNVAELARQLHINPQELLQVLPQYGFDIGQKAVKVDDRVADGIIRRWKYIKRDIEEKKRQELEEKKRLETELRRQSGQTVSLSPLITVRDFAAKLGLPVTQVIMELMKNGILANQNQNIDYETAAIIAEELGFSVQPEQGKVGEAAQEQQIATALEEAKAKATNLVSRPPVIVVMGHVDHGKTRLLDAIRETHVMEKEAGGITQHIGAYQTIWKDPKTAAERALTFIDTPGHEAFTMMRSRGAQVADIAILVVAADDGVKPQTEEVIKIIQAAKLPVVVAINKIDKEGADPQRVRTELSQRNIIPEEWGGNVPMVEISAKQKLHLDKLLDVLLLVADLEPDRLQADPHLPAVGTVIESHLDKNIGPVATVLVQAGTLRKNDPLVVNGEIYGKIRAMKNDRGVLLEEGNLSAPVQIIGFKVAPQVGDILDVSKAGVASMIDVKQKKLQQTGAERQPLTLAASAEGEEEEKKKTLNLVIKADVLGSLEAILASLEKITHDEVGVKIVGKGLGNITEDDVKKAQAGSAIIVGFNVNTTPVSVEMIRDNNLNFLRYEIIYDLINFVKAELEKMLEYEKIVTELGRVKILALFRTDKGAMTVGGRVEEGKVKRDSLARVKRDGRLIGAGKIVTCQTGQQEMKEVPSGTECGLRFEGKTRIEVDDVLEIYSEETKARKIVFQ